MSESTSGYLTPDEITGATFDTKRRGVDPDAVKRHLSAVAATVHGLLAERNTLAEQVASLNEQLATPVPQDELDEDALTERLGQDAARVLAEARSAAADRIAEAEVQADDIRAAAEELYAERSAGADVEAARIREAAESTLRERTEEAERAAAQIIARAEADAETLRASVVGERQSADADASRIVREAELTRRQILEDLARRRSAARRQIEQLRAGRERLLASHETVRRALDDISEELTISMSEARAAAETAGHSVTETTIEELEAEIETAKLTGLLDTGPVPVVTTPPEADAAPAENVDGAEASTEEASAATPFNHEVDAPEVQETDDAEAAQKDAAASEEPVETRNEPSGAGLAEVVQLDRARHEVDTGTHPATGRDTSTTRNGGSSSASVSAKEDTADTSEKASTPVLEAVASPSDEAASSNDDSVDDLFASLRSAPSEKPKPKSTGKKKASAKKTTAKKKSSTPKTKSAATKKTDDTVAVESAEMARRLKRVLADEQSKAMSQLKAAASPLTLDELLGDTSAHLEGYWVEVTTQIENVSDGDEQLKKPVDELVGSIRRRVGEALADAGDDTEGALASLRNVYREVKTQRIGVCADEVCQMATGRSADRS